MLEGTRWELTWLKDFKLPSPGGKQTPWLTLDAGEHRVSGYNGCNRMTSSYELNGRRLSFGAMAATRMACVAGMDVEQRFSETLPRVAGWRIKGRRLYLFDADGNLLARLIAVREESKDNS